MVDSARRWLLWSPRILGILISLFLSGIALDVFGGGKSLLEALPAFLIHASPTLLLLAVVALSWRRAWVGSVAFVVLGAAFGVIAIMRGNAYAALFIAGPLLGVGALFFWSWRQRQELHDSVGS